MIHNKLFLLLPTVAILATVLTLATFTIPTFAQSEGTNQSMKNVGESVTKLVRTSNKVPIKVVKPFKGMLVIWVLR